ncbi:MAG: HAD family hydrolase [Planctomycetota bacterium]
MTAEERIACLDVSGTVLHHQDIERAVPLMPQLLQTMTAAGWRVMLATRWSSNYATEKLQAAGVSDDVEIIQTEEKDQTTKQLLDENPDAVPILFVDDNPTSITAVSEAGGDRVRAVSFTGSRKYCPQLSNASVAAGVEMALSAPDLAETLCVPLGDHVGSPDLSAEEWAALIPGLDHPLDDEVAQTEYFDHAWPLGRLREADPNWWERAWPQAAWVSCSDCLWKLMVCGAVAAAGLEEREIVRSAQTARHYAQAVNEASSSVQKQLEPQFAVALESVVRGLAEIGAEAQNCRPKNRPMEEGRVGKVLDWLTDIYGRSPWLREARTRLEETITRTMHG